ncbi:MAG: hydrogenase formation protein HypD [Nitrospiraceae bacterium]|nr:hydrogenase formation protein HypD [Nitrospiraceae bacterium]
MALNKQIERQVEGIRRLLVEIGRPVNLMEVCGTHTVSIFRHGLRGMFEGIRFLSGPGCPVCVTSGRDVDGAVLISRESDVALATFGDMMRVPGSLGNLDYARACGADIRIVYSALDALQMARMEKTRRVVFFSTGFETTAPGAAAIIHEAREEGIGNFSVYSVHKLVPPALRALLSTPGIEVDGFLLPGHVSTIIGVRPYEFIAADNGKPAVIAGFSAEDIIGATLMLLGQIRRGRAAVEVQYRTAVRAEGNRRALAMMEECFEPDSAWWRGIGAIPASGLRIREGFAAFDAARVFAMALEGVMSGRQSAPSEPPGCSCGDVLRGLKIPTECRLFGKKCTPESPVGACMVSAEGSCAAYYKYGSPGR